MFPLFSRDYFSFEEKQALVHAIQAVELKTSGELKVHVEDYCGKNLDARMKEVFVKLRLHQTAQRNGVLIYLAIKDRKVGVLGDSGIHAKVPTDYWAHIIEQMKPMLSEGKILEALLHAINEVGHSLTDIFPYSGDEDKNEIPDDISFS